MRILFVSESWYPAMNGVATSSARVVDELRSRGHEVAVIAPGRRQGDRDDIVRVSTLWLRTHSEYALGRLDEHARALFARWHPDLVHVASPLSLGWSALSTARRLGIPSLAAYLTDFPAFARQAMRFGPARDAACRMFTSVQRHAHALAVTNVACSDYALRALHAWGSPQPRVWLRSVDTVRFSPAARRRRLAAGATGPLRIGYAGRLAPEKELHLLAGLRGIDNTRLVVVGDGPSRRRLQALLPEAEFTGRLDGRQYSDTIAGLDLFVHPGRGETLSQVVLEALASGVPCVVPARDSASSELVVDGVSGAHFDGGDPSSLRHVVRGLLRQPPHQPDAVADTVAHRTWAASMDSLLASYDVALAV